MDKLKTLKDIIKPIELKRYSRKEIPIIIINKFFDEVRAEAIKWHKNLDKFRTNSEAKPIDDGVKLFIETFFNITEEDLKDEN